jgi:outer membrane protein assembly factor BamD
MRRRPGRHQAVILLLLAFVACSSKKPLVPPDQLWSEANRAFGDEAYELAVDRYKALLDQHPFDPNAEEAELRIAQSHYLAGRYAEAIAAFGDFERMHPTSPQLPLVEYQLGMSYLAQATTADRDQAAYTNALTYFRNVVDRFPRSAWAERARLRIRECREALAGHEADVAGYYLRQGHLRAAEARLRRLLTEFADAEATARLLYDFAKTYVDREEPEGATLALATLLRTHPEGELGREAQERLGTSASDLIGGQDPLPLLLARIDRMRLEPGRRDIPRTVSAYPDVGGSQAP